MLDKTALNKGDMERALCAKGLSLVGVDEVGRGCIAGPVVAACVRLDYIKLWSLPETSLHLIRDSKTLSSLQRQSQLAVIHSLSTGIGIGEASAREIEDVGISQATFLAMNRAISQISGPIDLLLVDGNQKIKGQSYPQQTVVKGDRLCFAIAAASILAKEHRDDFMRSQSEVYPSYGFSNHVGYGTAHHLQAIQASGICPLHRRNFAPLRGNYT